MRVTTAVAADPQAKRWVGPALRLAAGVLVLAVLVSRIDLAEATVRWDGRALGGIAAAIALICLANGFSTARWRFVLGSDAPGFGYLFRLYFVGGFFSLFLPTSVGGDAVRAVAISRATGRPGPAVSSVVLERLLGLVAMAGVLLAGVVLAPAVRGTLGELVEGRGKGVDPGLALAAGGAVLVGAAAVAAGLRVPRVRAILEDAGRLWRSFVTRPKVLVLALAASLLVQLTYVAVWYGLAVALALPVPGRDLLLLVPFVSLAAMIPVTLAGLGLREGAWVLLLAGYGVPAADALAFGLLYLVALLAVGAMGGVAFALRGLAPSASTAPTSAAASRSQL